METSITLNPESYTGDSEAIIQEVAGAPKEDPATQNATVKMVMESPGDAKNQGSCTQDAEIMVGSGAQSKDVDSRKLKRKKWSGAKRKKMKKLRNLAQNIGFGIDSLAKGHPSGAPTRPIPGPSDTLKRTGLEDLLPGEGKKARPTWPLTYAAQPGIKATIVEEGFPQVMLTKDKGNLIQVAVCELMDKLPEGGDVLRFYDCYLSKGALIVVCHDKTTWMWLKTAVPTIKAWEGSRLKVREDAPPAYKKFMAWFPGPEVENEVLLQRLEKQNPGISTKQWRIHDHKVEPRGVRIAVSVDIDSAEFILLKTSKLYYGLSQAAFMLVEADTREEEENAEIQQCWTERKAAADVHYTMESDVVPSGFAVHLNI